MGEYIVESVNATRAFKTGFEVVRWLRLRNKFRKLVLDGLYHTGDDWIYIIHSLWSETYLKPNYETLQKSIASLVPGFFLVSNVPSFRRNVTSLSCWQCLRHESTRVLCTKKAVLTKEVFTAIKRQRRQCFLPMTHWLEYSLQEGNLALLAIVQSRVKPNSVLNSIFILKLCHIVVNFKSDCLRDSSIIMSSRLEKTF